MIMKVSILIPYYNEIDNLQHYDSMLFPVVDEIMDEYGYDCEYLFYNDGSTDGGSLNYILTFDKYTKYEIKYHANFINMGLGKAIERGVQYCRGDYIIILDADLTYRPSSIRDLFECLKEHPKVDCISSSPYQYPHLLSITKSYRYFGSIIFNKIYSMLIGHHITCATSMFRLYKSEVIRNMNLKSTGFDVNAEILFNLLLDGREVIEIPVTLYDRDYGVSKMHVMKELWRGIGLMIKIINKRFLNH